MPDSVSSVLSGLSLQAAVSRVLVVDDDPDLLAVSQKVLTKAGYEVHSAEDGADAIERLDRTDFDLVVSDVDMPRIDGVQLLKTVRDTERHTPFIFITGNPRLETAIFAVNHGVVYYLTKPFDPAELAAAASRAIGTRRLDRLREHMANVVANQSRVRDEERSRFEGALRQLFMAYQPIVHWPTRTVYGNEALVRTKEASIPNPSELFKCAERLGEVDQLSRAIRRSCAETIAQHPEAPLFFVNLHARDLRDPQLTDGNGPLARFAHKVVLEVAERASIDNIKEAAASLEKLRAMGYRIAVDDIGSGYAGLNSFALLEPEVVKLDMALVRDVDSSTTKQRLIESFVGLCKELGILVIAEGVETTAELETLSSLGCELFQGYLLARPEPRVRTAL